MPRKRLTDRDGEVRELTRDDIAAMNPFKDVFPELLKSWKRSRSRTKLSTQPQKESPVGKRRS